MTPNACSLSIPVLVILAGFAFNLPAAQPAPRSGSDAPGMYSDYSDRSRARLDRYLGDISAMPMNQLVPALLDAINQLSKYPRPKHPPAIQRVPRHVIEDKVCGRACGARAAYSAGDGILIDESMQPETSLFDRSVLLHELMHYVQDLADEHGEMAPCKRWYFRELEAYAIQKRFLILVGSPVRVGYSAARSTCDETVQSWSAGSLPGQ